MYQAGALPRLPFYDTRMTDFFATVPSAFVEGRRLQIDYLKRFAPDLARITWQAYGTNLYRVAHFDTWLLPARAVKKAMRALASRPVPERNWEVQFLGAEGRRGLEKHLIEPGRKLHAFVDPREVRTLLDGFFASPLEEGRGYTVSMLLTFAAFLEAHA
jgi:asparagine synthase (glutamine-hydrolysing)